jgi:hypothetical protein
VSHTPGAWFADTDLHGVWSVYVTDPDDRAGPGQTEPDLVIVAEALRSEADARLIAAAPDLLATLIELRDHLRTWGEPLPGFPMAERFARIDAVIAQATEVQS